MGDESDALNDQADETSDPRSSFYIPPPRRARAAPVSRPKVPAPSKGVPSSISELAASVLNRSLGRKGQIAGFLWNRPLATRKGVDSVVTKEVRCIARVGIDYDRQAVVQAGRESGELPAQNAGLPWGQWLQFPYLIEHRDNLYLRLYPLAGNEPKVIYRLNGQVARREEVEPLCLAKEFREHDGACITLNLNHLRRMR